MKTWRIVPQKMARRQESQMAFFQCKSNLILEIAKLLKADTGKPTGETSLYSHYCMPCSEGLRFYVQSKRGTSPVSKCREPGFYTVKIRNLSRPAIEPRTFGLAYLRANH